MAWVLRTSRWKTEDERFGEFEPCLMGLKDGHFSFTCGIAVRVIFEWMMLVIIDMSEVCFLKDGLK